MAAKLHEAACRHQVHNGQRDHRLALPGFHWPDVDTQWSAGKWWRRDTDCVLQPSSARLSNTALNAGRVVPQFGPASP